jgi:hypothetical protein
VLITGSWSSFGLTDLGLGAIVLSANLFLLALSTWWCLLRWRAEHERLKLTRVLNEAEFQVVTDIMAGCLSTTTSVASASAASARGGQARSGCLLDQYLLKPENVKLVERIGAGSFG